MMLRRIVGRGVRRRRMYKKYLKRLLDIVLSALGLILLTIPMLVIAVIVKLDSEGPAVFWQERAGLHKTSFRMPKFRSMYTKAPADIPKHLLSDPSRWITRSGRVLRRFSLDELPQLWSILVGDMSVVGPRPVLWTLNELIEERDKYGANDVRPGLTGWAQINGRDEIPIPVKARLDGEYVEKMSFWFDCKCFFGTFGKVLRGDGIREGSEAAPDWHE